MQLSRRSAFAREPNRLAQRLAALAKAGRAVLDLTESNPTRVGLEAPELVALLGDARGARYAVEPLGLASARRAVADYYARRGAAVDPGRVVLSASTSESYAWLFKLLCDAGDAVLVPQPSYPLFPFLAALESVELASYPLVRQEGWRVDAGALRRVLDDTPRARALLLVHPGNPTGSFVHAADRAALVALAVERGLALVVDEVFWDYRHGAAPPSFAAEREALCFVLSGLSKVALLPQVKLGWIAVGGPAQAADEALGRLEVIADSYLSVSTPVQLAAPALLAAADRVQRTLHERLRENLTRLDAVLAASRALRRLPVEGGWYALVEVPRTKSDEAWVEQLLEEEGVLVHPGYFFDVEEEGTMVVSLLLEPERFGRGIERAAACWAAG